MNSPNHHSLIRHGSVDRLSIVTIGALAGILMLFGGAAFAQNVGEVQIYVFSEAGIPLDDVSVQADGEVYESDAAGLIDFTHPPGTHEFTILRDGKPVGRVRVSIRQAQATEVIVTASEKNMLQGGTDVDAERAEIEESRRESLDADAPRGTLVGEVTAIETGDPVANATVIFRGVDFETGTNSEGEFSAELPAGSYSFSVIHPDFSTQTRDEVEVAANQQTIVEVTLTPSAIRLEEVPVFASEEVIVQGGIANLIEETRNSGVVLNLIGAEQIDRTGDSTAAGALARVTGLNVLGGRYVYVRGMGERYSTSLLNDARLPSPEPDRRVVPLDLFPASVIESIAVQKTYSPELQGDFGGGAISIRSAGIPDDRYQRRLRTNISVSVGYNVGTTLTEQLMSQGGALDFLGIDDGTRKLPAGLEEVDYAAYQTDLFGQQTSTLSQEEIDELAKQLPNTWSPVSGVVPLNYGLNLSVRDKIELGDDRNLGFNIAGLYSNSWGYTEGQLNSYINTEEGFGEYNTYDTRTTSQDVDVGALLDLKYAHNRRFELETTSLLVRTTDSTFELLEGYLLDENWDVRLGQAKWQEQMLFSQGLSTQAEPAALNQSIVNAQYVFSVAQRYSPDARYYRYDEVLSGFTRQDGYNEEYGHISFQTKDANQRVWTTVRDLVHDGRLGVEVPVFLFGNSAPDFLDVGASAMYQSRETDLRRFTVEPASSLVPTLRSNEYFHQQSPGEIFQPSAIGSEIEFEEGTYLADNYTGSHFIGSGFVSADVLLPLDVRMNAGTRVEYSRQTVTAYTFPDAVLEEPVLETVDWLPALNFTVPLTRRTQLRLGGSRTINRPDLRELSAAPFFGPPGFGVIKGNPDLRRAVIWNADLRWEAYFSMYESVSAGVFYKFFQDAIEIAQIQGPAFEKVPVNTAEAYNIGAEIEWAVQLRFVSDLLRRLMLSLDFDSLARERRWRRGLGAVSAVFRDLRTTGNAAYIQSQIDYGDQNLTYRGTTVANTSTERPLQGQAPYVINAALGYRNEVSWSQSRPYHTSIFLNYNIVGPFITQLGVESVPDQYQQPFHQLDLVFRQQFGHIFSIGFEAGNLINPPAEVRLGTDGQIVESAKRGRTFSLSVSFDI